MARQVESKWVAYDTRSHTVDVTRYTVGGVDQNSRVAGIVRCVGYSHGRRSGQATSRQRYRSGNPRVRGVIFSHRLRDSNRANPYVCIVAHRNSGNLRESAANHLINLAIPPHKMSIKMAIPYRHAIPHRRRIATRGFHPHGQGPSLPPQPLVGDFFLARDSKPKGV